MDSDKGQREGLLSGEAEKGSTSPSVGSSSFKIALQVMSMLLLVVILCTLVAGIAFVAGTRSNESPEEDGKIVVLGASDVHDPKRIIRSAPNSATCSSRNKTCDIPAAHVVGAIPGFYDGSVPREVTSGRGISMSPINMNWTCSGSRGLVQGGMQLMNGGYLVVPRSGLYYVYSQLRLIDKRTNRLFPVGNSLLKWSHRTRQWTMILEAALPVTAVTKAEASSYHAGVFALEAGDMLGVQVNRYRDLNQNVRVKLVAEESYFGAFLISRYTCYEDHGGS